MAIANQKSNIENLLAAMLVCGLATGCSWLNKASNDPVVQSGRLADEARQEEQRGELRRSADLLARAARVNPTDADIHRQLARLLLAQGQSDAAVEHLRQVVYLDPDDPWGWVQLAQVQIEHQEYGLALQPLEAALQLDPVHIDALLLKAKLAERQHDDRLALETYHRVLGIDPANNDAKLRIAALQLKSERPERAAPLLRSVCQSSQATEAQTAEAEWLLGVCYGRRRRWADAAAALSVAIRHRPEATADDWYRLAFARYKAGDFDGARDDSATALELDSHHASASAMVSALQRGTDLRRETIIPVGHTVGTIPVPAGW